ncbi:MAG: phosphoribosylformylglycinamidine cyclo-ligase [Acidobacteria bacterium]|nr:phosphoribosylformylglycinamidine cyclo-ligase [Acidobacteriota bacterium]
MDYKTSGVDIDAGTEVVERVKRFAKSTFTEGVLSDIGAFGGLFRPELSGMNEPVLVASADGVGTKLAVASAAGVHTTVGVDLVNHCVNDILVQGARPVFFLDYLATGRLSPDVSAAVIEGIAIGCRQNGCALLGGETAEMPGFYTDGQYDLAGFVVGLVDRARIIDGRSIVPGDVLIGLPSSGLHTNGYSLARRILFDRLGLRVDSVVEALDCTVGEELLRTHRSYQSAVRPVIETGCVKGIAHITGGGLTENVPRILPDGCAAIIDPERWEAPPIFDFLRERGEVPEADMYRTFNMGIGLVVVCGREDAHRVVSKFITCGEIGAGLIGNVGEAGDGKRLVQYARVELPGDGGAACGP